MKPFHPWTATLAITFAAVGMTVAVAAVGVPQYLGAHPWWAQSTALIGGVIGGVFSLVLRAAPGNTLQHLLSATVLLALALLVARWGGQTFAASYAESVVAGRVWYFGWIATAALNTTVLSQVGFLIREKVANRDHCHIQTRQDMRP